MSPDVRRAEVLRDLAEEIRAINAANGWRVFVAEQWNDPYKIPAILALIHSETSEALEAFRANDRDNFMEELADIAIRVLDLAGGFPEWQFAIALEEKLEKNRARGWRHGGKTV